MNKKIKKFFQPIQQPQWTSTTLLLLRTVVGLAFILHGWGKIQTPFGWMPPGAPFPIPSIFQFLAAVSEFGGGIALILGCLFSVALLGMAVTMIVAVYMHMIVMKDPFVNMLGGGAYELPLVYLAIFLLFLTTGPGNYSVDAKVYGKRKG